MAPVEVPDGVGRTAVGMALIRADESRRSDRLFDDPYAAAFVMAAAGAVPRDRPSDPDDPMAGVVHSAVIRTRFYDDYLQDASQRGCRQIVLLGAGLDSRAYRLAWPAGMRLWEIDQPGVLAFKQHVLADAGAVPGCQRVTIEADLRNEWTDLLLAAGLQSAQPVAWLLEGLLIYLTEEQAAALLNGIIAVSALGSRLACERQAGSELSAAPTGPRLAPFAEMWKGGLGTTTSRWLTRHGWQVQAADRDTVAAGYGRPAPAPSDGGYLLAIRT